MVVRERTLVQDAHRGEAGHRDHPQDRVKPKLPRTPAGRGPNPTGGKQERDDDELSQDRSCEDHQKRGPRHGGLTSRPDLDTSAGASPVRSSRLLCGSLERGAWIAWPNKVFISGKRNIADSGLENAIQVRERNFFSDDLGSGYDTALLFNIIHGMTPEQNMTLAEFVIQRKFVAKLIREHKIGLARDRQAVELVTPFLLGKGEILDIGSGLCRIAKILQDKGYQVTSVDIQNLSIVEEIKPIICDGKRLPFKNNSFDTALLLTVLHHTADPEAILKEAKRVSKKIIIIEDIYKNTAQKYFTFVVDSLVNLEFFGHPHTNKSDVGWKMLFKGLNLNLKGSMHKKIWKVLTAAYFLEK